MKILLPLFVIVPLFVLAQPKTKKIFVEGNGPPVVLLNGGTFDMTAFAPHAKLLADSFTVIRMEQFNTQYADNGLLLPNNYSVNTESNAVAATLDSMNITEPIILAGHSYGGVIAFDFAMNYPNRVKSLVLIEAPLYDLARQKENFTPQMDQIEKLTEPFTPQAIITEDMIKSFRCALTNCDTTDIQKHPMWPQWVLHKDRLKGLSAVPAYKVDLKKMEAFRKPVLIVTGTTTIDANKINDSLLVREFPSASKASLEGEHIAVYKNAAVFNTMLRDFLHQQTSRFQAK